MQLRVYKRCPRISESIVTVFVMQKQNDLSEVQKGTIIGFRDKDGSISEKTYFVNYLHSAGVKVKFAWQNDTIQNK